MVTDTLLDLMQQMFTWAASLRPQWQMTLPPAIHDVVAEGMAVDGLLPIHEVFTVLSSLLLLLSVAQIYKWSIKLIDWIADIIP